LQDRHLLIRERTSASAWMPALFMFRNADC